MGQGDRATAAEADEGLPTARRSDPLRKGLGTIRENEEKQKECINSEKN